MNKPAEVGPDAAAAAKPDGTADDGRGDEAGLVEQARAGDPEAFRVLVERYQRKLYGLALAMVKEPDEARDVVQEAFLKAWRNLDRFEGQAKFYTWLYRIATNLCIDRARSRRRAPQVEFDEAIDREEQGASGISPQRLGFDPGRALHDREIREQVTAALGRLSPIHRSVLLLREVEGLAYKEIAEAMQCSEGTVMSRLFHARKRMQQMLRALVDGSLPEEEAGGSDERETGDPETGDLARAVSRSPKTAG